MIAFVARRILWALFVLLPAVTFITFALGFYGPGDPVQIMLGPRSNPEAVERVRHELGLDKPLLVQYTDYLGKLAQGDLGTSLKFRGQPVSRLLERCISVSAPLNAVTLLWSVPLGILLGLLAAYKKDRPIDRIIVITVVVGIAMPVFAVAPILLYVFAVTWHLLPPGGWEGIFSTNIILPTIVLGLGVLAVMVRQTRASVLETIGQDYVQVAYAKGLRARDVLSRHVLKNSLIPVVTIAGYMLGGLVGGSLLTELIFGIPGCGRLAFEAFGARDYPLIMAFTLLTAVAFILANLLVDLLYFFLDPRIRRP